MKHSTFKNKINAKYPQYKLTESEQQKLIEVLKEMATDKLHTRTILWHIANRLL